MKIPKTQGWYYFADGFSSWFHGLSATEKRNLEREHGKVILFRLDK